MISSIFWGIIDYADLHILRYMIFQGLAIPYGTKNFKFYGFTVVWQNRKIKIHLTFTIVLQRYYLSCFDNRKICNTVYPFTVNTDYSTRILDQTI